MPTYVSGDEGVAKADSVDLNVTHWKGVPRNGIIDTTNTSTQGFETYIGGVTGMDITCDAFFDTDTGAGPFSNPPNLLPGQIVTMSLRIGTTAMDFAASVIIESVDVDSDVKGGVKYTMTGKTSGPITFPSL